FKAAPKKPPIRLSSLAYYLYLADPFGKSEDSLLRNHDAKLIKSREKSNVTAKKIFLNLLMK
ncbi:MAG: hypothetical protein K2H38_02955, partial [Muribaculaceae bacterium]|nr:hypothetical protein [Muribaculaceae bacterium]